MSNVKISDMTLAVSLTGTELVELDVSGVTKSTTVQDIADLAGGGSPYFSVVGYTDPMPSPGLSFNGVYSLPANSNFSLVGTILFTNVTGVDSVVNFDIFTGMVTNSFTVRDGIDGVLSLQFTGSFDGAAMTGGGTLIYQETGNTVSIANFTTVGFTWNDPLVVTFVPVTPVTAAVLAGQHGVKVS